MRFITIILVLLLLCWNFILQYNIHETKNHQEEMFEFNNVTILNTLNQANNLIEDYYVNENDVSIYIAIENLADLSRLIRHYDYIDQPSLTFWSDLSQQLGDSAVALSDALSSKDKEKMHQIQETIESTVIVFEKRVYRDE